MKKSIFVTFDGQHGTGKSYITNFLKNRLSKMGYSVVVECEPTSTELGRFARSSEQSYSGETLACLFAADRHEHSETIIDKLKSYDIVLCDRYLISSLILQNMDNVDFQFIRNANSGVLTPDLQVVLYAESDIVGRRLENKILSRLAQQERLEKYDRYRIFEKDIISLVGDVNYFPNNSAKDAEKILDFIMKFIAKSGD